MSIVFCLFFCCCFFGDHLGFNVECLDSHLSVIALIKFWPFFRDSQVEKQPKNFGDQFSF